MSAKYDDIGINYNQTRHADPHLTDRLLKLLNPKAEGLYLDIGCGTGNYTIAMQDQGFQFIGIDPSIEMLQKARLKNKIINWQMGTAEKTNLPEQSVDGIVATLTVHHWTNLSRAFSELAFVLKPQGRMVIFTSTPQQMQGYWLNHYFPKMLQDSMLQMPSLEKIEKALTLAGFKIKNTEEYAVKPDLKDQFLYCGKDNPEFYFDEHIRLGISSFSALANKSEVEDGLTKLRKDIDSGTITEVMQSYKNTNGDYLFLVIEHNN